MHVVLVLLTYVKELAFKQSSLSHIFIKYVVRAESFLRRLHQKLRVIFKSNFISVFTKVLYWTLS
jgi:hypothetical protein